MVTRLSLKLPEVPPGVEIDHSLMIGLGDHLRNTLCAPERQVEHVGLCQLLRPLCPSWTLRRWVLFHGANADLRQCGFVVHNVKMYAIGCGKF